MNTRKSTAALGIIDFLFIGIYAVYLLSPINLGYYPIGIVQMILLITALVLLLIYGISLFKDKEKDKWTDYIPIGLLIFGYLTSIGVIGLSLLFWWVAFIL